MRHNHGIEALELAVLQTPGHTDLELRKKVFDGEDVDESLQSYLEKVSAHAYKVTNEDVAELLAGGWSQDEVFELTLAAALRQCVDRYRRGVRELS